MVAEGKSVLGTAAECLSLCLIKPAQSHVVTTVLEMQSLYHLNPFLGIFTYLNTFSQVGFSA